jgi:hypothetical protein
MKTGFERTFQLLSRTRNEAAIDVLVAGLENSHAPTQEASLQSLLDRPNAAGHLAVFWRLPKLSPSLRAMVEARPDRLAGAAGDAVRNSDAATGASACEAIVACRLYEAIPALLGVLDRENHPNIPLAASTVLRLADLFYEELSRPDRQPRRKEFDNVRQRLTASLEEGFRKYWRHGRREVVEAFLMLGKPQNVGFRYALQQTGGSTDAVLEILEKSPRGGIIRLLLSFLEDPMMPQAIRKILATRSDPKFVENFATAAAERMSKAAEVLAKFDGFSWVDDGGPMVVQMSGPSQACIVQVLRATAVRSARLLGLLEPILRDGAVQGRRAAASALAEVHGSVADECILRFLDDPDPVVQATLVRQVRTRGMAHAMSTLLKYFDTPYEEVRSALRETLPEFTVVHFLANLDHIDESMVQATGQMVRKIDPNAAGKLKAEMQRLSPVRRRRAVLAANAMGIAAELESQLIQLLNDDDHMVRLATAQALEEVGTKPSWEALRDALLDRSVIVQEAAEKSLERITLALRDVPDELETETVPP